MIHHLSALIWMTISLPVPRTSPPHCCQLCRYPERRSPARTYPAHRPPSHSRQGLKGTERQKVIENSQGPRTQFQSRPRHTAQLAQPSPQGQLGKLQPERLHTQHRRVSRLCSEPPAAASWYSFLPDQLYLNTDSQVSAPSFGSFLPSPKTEGQFTSK